MDRKHHWAWPAFADGTVTISQLRRHFQQEYSVYVRDFPVFLAHIYGQNPPAPVRRMLADNIYEEDTGGLSLGKSHPELFLTMMAGLGLPASRRYRAWLDRVSNNRDWVIGAAALTVFVEGSLKDRAEISAPSKPKTAEDIEAIVHRHPLVKHHGLPADSMDLIRAHQMVEAGHRHDAYAMVVDYATTYTQQRAVLSCLKKCLTLWQAYRDAVAKVCGIKKS
jgi:pyrroloquinoline-quinone synthase